jgi:transposase
MKLYYLDECGYKPSLPTGYSWCLPGQRKRVKYEYPQGRRVNALASFDPSDPNPWLHLKTFERTLASDDLLEYLRGLPVSETPRVVILDNVGIHTSQVVKAARASLAGLGIYLYYLPAYSPELNLIESVFKQVKHHDIPIRSHTSQSELRQAVAAGFETRRHRLQHKCDNGLRLAA